MQKNNETIRRQLITLRALSSRRDGLYVEDLATELGVSLKTVRRDLHRLRDVGFPLTKTNERHGRARWSLDDETITATGLTFDEAFALILATRTLGSLAGTEIGTAADSAVAKLRSGLSESVLEYCDSLARLITNVPFRDVDYGDQAEIFETILLGHEERVNVFIGYRSRRATEPISYPISPYAIRHYQNSIYVIGFSEQHDAVRCFKLDRISEAEQTNVPFTIPNNFDVAEHLSPAFGIQTGTPVQVILEIAPSAARPMAESKWHPTQTNHFQPDGSLHLEMRVTPSPEFQSWILSIGPEAKVLSPQSLADTIAEQARSIAARYSDASTHAEVSPDEA